MIPDLRLDEFAQMSLEALVAPEVGIASWRANTWTWRRGSCAASASASDQPGSPRIARAKLAAVFMVLLTSCLLTESIGIHALFGAFLASVIMPEEGAFKTKLVASIEDVSTLAPSIGTP